MTPSLLYLLFTKDGKSTGPQLFKEGITLYIAVVAIQRGANQLGTGHLLEEGGMGWCKWGGGHTFLCT